jgi:hypothetical protein
MNAVPSGERQPNERLAQLLGLDRWGVGVHRRPTRKDPTRQLWVQYLWRVSVWPSFASFDGRFELAGVQAHNWVPTSGRAWRKAALASAEEAFVLQLRFDPVVRRLNRVPLVAPSDILCFDGISYYVEFLSGQVEGNFSFSNPISAPFTALERTFARLGSRIAKASGSADLLDCARVWRSYCNRGD